MSFFILYFFLNFNLVKTWYSIETTHFVIYYYDGLENFAQRTAKVLEERTYPAVTSILGNPLDRKTHVVIIDIDDIGNGFALEILDQIFIFAADIYYVPLRGRHPWLEGVITHEFAHIVALRKVKKTSRYFPSFLIQGGLFCAIYKGCSIGNIERKPTLIGGFTFGQVPYSEPSYFTEGIAQLVTQELGYDSLDSYRDMFLRTLLYYGKLYPLNKLWNFEAKTAWEGEIVYNHGFSFLNFIKDRYGWDALRKVMDYSSGFFNFSYESAFEYATSKKMEELEKEWRDWLSERYAEQIKRFEESQGKFRGEIVPLEKQKIGLYKRNIYYVSYPKPYTTGFFVVQDRFLTFYDSPGSKAQRIFFNVDSYALSGTHIAISFSKPTREFLFFGSVPESYFQLSLGRLEYEQKDGVLRVKVKDLKDVAKRASHPAFSPDGKKLLYVKNEIDSRNIFLYDLESGKEERITDFHEGKQFTFPSFSQDGKFIVSAYFNGKTQDIVLIDSTKRNIKDENELTFITQDIYEEREPIFISDNLILFSSDRDGVFNIYATDIVSGDLWKITEEISGALFPSFGSSSGELFYVSFEPEGFRVRKLKPGRENWILVYTPTDYKGKIFPELKNESEEDDFHIVSLDSGEKGSTMSESQSDTENKEEPEKLSDYRGEKVGPLKLSSPLILPIFGLSLSPLLTSTSQNFFIPLDIFGVSLQGESIDRLGRFDLVGAGFLGFRGSWQIATQLSSYHFRSFIPSLFAGSANIKAVPVASGATLNISQAYSIFDFLFGGQILFPVIIGPRRPSFQFLLGSFGEFYSVSAKLSGLVITPFSQEFSARSGRFFGAFSSSFPIPSPLGPFQLFFSLESQAFYTTFEESLKQFEVRELLTSSNYFSQNLLGILGAIYSLPIGFQRNILLGLQFLGGYTFRNVDIFDEFRDAYLGYLQVFFGDKFLQGDFISSFDLWYGYIPLFSGFSFHKFSLGFIFNSFQFRQKNESFDFAFCSDNGFWCSGSVAMFFYGSAFYVYQFVLYSAISRGFQDPLKAPFRIYFGIGLGF